MTRGGAKVQAMALAVLAVCAVPTAAAAYAGAGGTTTAPRTRPAEQTAQFWRAVREPGYSQSRALLRQGVERLAHAIRAFIREPHMPHLGRAHVESALVRLHLAHARAPRDSEALHILVMARIMWRTPGGTSRLTDDDQQTLALLERLRALDPEYQASRVAFELGILHTRGHDFERAAAEYERCLQRTLLPTEEPPSFRTPEDLLADRLFGPVPAPTVHYNLGDVTMALGNLPTAIVHYRRAVEEARSSSHEFRTVLLASWGLAAALDRFGEHAAALEHAREAIRLDAEPMEVLHHPSVFFEPSFEIHYYEALGHTVLGSDVSGELLEQAEERREALERGVRSWERFLAEGGDKSPWADVARRHLADLRARVARPSSGRSSARNRR
jgi:tetratricopeptide (TPR) repeat protein